jgi:hypothetical protein
MLSPEEALCKSKRIGGTLKGFKELKMMAVGVNLLLPKCRELLSCSLKATLDKAIGYYKSPIFAT